MAVEMHGQKVKKKYMLNQINPYMIFPAFLICVKRCMQALASRRALKGSVHFRFKQIRSKSMVMTCYGRSQETWCQQCAGAPGIVFPTYQQPMRCATMHTLRTRRGLPHGRKCRANDDELVSMLAEEEHLARMPRPMEEIWCSWCLQLPVAHSWGYGVVHFPYVCFVGQRDESVHIYRSRRRTDHITCTLFNHLCDQEGQPMKCTKCSLRQFWLVMNECSK